MSLCLLIFLMNTVDNFVSSERALGRWSNFFIVVTYEVVFLTLSLWCLRINCVRPYDVSCSLTLAHIYILNDIASHFHWINQVDLFLFQTFHSINFLQKRCFIIICQWICDPRQRTFNSVSFLNWKHLVWIKSDRLFFTLQFKLSRFVFIF